MPIFSDGLRTEQADKPVTDYDASFGSSLGAAAEEAFDDLPTVQLYGIGQLRAANGNNAIPQTDALGNPITTSDDTDVLDIAAPRIDRTAAVQRVKDAGLDRVLHLPDAPDIAEPALQIMMDRARTRQERAATVQRGPDNLVTDALSVGTSFLVGALDPLNVATAFIPVVGEARYGKLLANAGESFLARAAVRAGAGAVEGAVGQAALEPLDYYAHSQDGRDFGMSDVLQNVIFGGVLGAALHAGGGSIGDALRKRSGAKLYPFGPGEPMEALGGGTHVPRALLDDAGVAPDQIPDHVLPGPDLHPAVEILNDLPPRAKEDAMRGALANLIDGEPVAVGEMLQIAAADDPRIAASFDAFQRSSIEADQPSPAAAAEAANPYRVRINASDDHFLDWGMPLNQQSDYVRKQLGEVSNSTQTGSDFFQSLSQANVVAGGVQRSPQDTLGDLGIRGIRYADGENPGSTSGKHNFVVFDDKHVEIVDRNGKPVSRRERTGAQALSAESRNWPALPEGAQIVDSAENGPVIDGLEGNWNDAVQWLREAQTGDVHGVLSHPSVPGSIDVIWGDKEHGLQHILDKHPDVVADLPQRLAEMKVVSRSSNRINLASDTTRAAVRLDYDGKQKTWLLTAFSPDEGGEKRGPDEMPGLRPAADLRTSPSQHYSDVGAGPDATIPVDTHSNKTRLPDVVTKDVKSAQLRGRAAADPKTWSLTEFLANEGGLAPHSELDAIYGGKRGPFLSGFGPLIRKNGRTLDDAFRVAKEGGYLHDASDVTGDRAKLNFNALLSKLDEEQAGRRQYRLDHLQDTAYDVEHETHVIRQELEHQIEATGGSLKDVDPKLLDRTVEIVRRDGETDVMNAFERAIMEDAERYEAIAKAREADHDLGHISGFDESHDAGPAPADGGPDPRDGGPAGSTGQGDRGPDGAQSRNGGAGAGGAPDQFWRDFARPRTGLDDAAVVAASRDAESLPEPIKTKLDERVAAAAKADADAERLYELMKSGLSDEDRQQLEDALRQLDLDNEAREEAIRRGGACMFGKGF